MTHGFRKFTKDQLVEQFQLNQSRVYLSKYFNCSSATISKYLVQLGLAKHLNKHISENLNHNEVLNKYSELQSTMKCAKFFNCSTGPIRTILGIYDAINPLIQYKLNETFFETDTEKSFYWAGFISADGSIIDTVKNSSLRMNIGLSQVDHNHLEKFKIDIGTDKPVYKYTRPDKRLKSGESKISTLTLISNKICTDLKRFDIEPRKSLTGTFPLVLSDNENIRHFMRGLFDGDGCVYFYTYALKSGTIKKTLCFKLTGTYDMCVGFRELLNRYAGINRNDGIARYGEVYNLQFHREDTSTNIYNYLFKNATVYLDRKFALIKPFLSENTLASMVIL